MRVLLSSVLVLLAGCVSPQPEAVEPRTLVQVVTKCPSEDQLRDAAVAASRATYRRAPGGSRTCPCSYDTYVDGHGKERWCGDPAGGAVKPASWVMCQRSDVPAEVVKAMRNKTGCS